MASFTEKMISNSNFFSSIGVGLEGASSNDKTCQTYLLREELDSPPLANPPDIVCTNMSARVGVTMPSLVTILGRRLRRMVS